jgi:hypothetical protein
MTIVPLHFRNSHFHHIGFSLFTVVGLLYDAVSISDVIAWNGRMVDEQVPPARVAAEIRTGKLSKISLERCRHISQPRFKVGKYKVQRLGASSGTL